MQRQNREAEEQRSLSRLDKFGKPTEYNVPATIQRLVRTKRAEAAPQNCTTKYKSLHSDSQGIQSSYHKYQLHKCHRSVEKVH